MKAFDQLFKVICVLIVIGVLIYACAPTWDVILK